MFEQAFNDIDADLRNEAVCTTELDYTEQASGLLFLKYLNGLEKDMAMEAELGGKLNGKPYAFIHDEPYRWSSCAVPKDKNGKLVHNQAQTGDGLREIIDHIDELRFRPQAESAEALASIRRLL